MYAGVAGNLVAFGCKGSFQRAHQRHSAFVSNTELAGHYTKTRGAELVGKRLMVIDTKVAIKLIDRYAHNGQ